MEDYEEFVANRLSQLRKSSAASPVSAPVRHLSTDGSLIRFYGRPVLPPLLSGEQRDEMRTLKEHLNKPAPNSRSTAGERVAQIQHILHSVQLRKAPTLEEFSEERSGLYTLSDSKATSNTSSSQRVHDLETKDHLPFSPPSCPQDGNIAPKAPPLTSTTYSEMPLDHPKQPPQYQADCFFNDSEESPHSKPIVDNSVDISQQSQSSGYVTYENAASVLGRVESLGESCVEGGKYSGGFFLCHPSNTAIQMPDIISHPPIDGEKLERSAIDSSIEDCLIANDMLTELCSADSPHKQSYICPISAESSPPDEDLVTCRPPTAQEILHEVTYQSEGCETFGHDENTSGKECPVSPMEVGLKAPQSSPISHHTTTTTNPPQVQGSFQEGGPVDALNHGADAGKPSETPCRLSLQALLKKSQECRQQQRMLRNRTRNCRVILERAQEEQPLHGEQEHSLSDKENEEFPHKVTERRKPKQRGGCIEHQAEMPVHKLVDEQNLSKVEDLTLKVPNSKDKLTSLHANTLDVGTNKMLPEDPPPAFSSKSAKELAQTPPDVPALPPAHFSPPDNESPTPSLRRSTSGRNYQLIPSPQLCTSPVHCKSKGLHNTGGPGGPVRGPHSQALFETAHHADGMPENAVQDGHENNPKHAAIPGTLLDEVCSARRLGRSSAHTQHIDQLELDLSSLKLLISELESTITENLKNQILPGNSSLSTGPAQILNHSDDILYGDGSLTEDSSCQRSQWLHHYRSNEEDADHDLCDFIDLPYIRPHTGADGNHGSTATALTAERAQQNSVLSPSSGGGGIGTPGVDPQGAERVPATGGIAVATSSGEHAASRIPQPSAKQRITSVSQRMLIPDVFRDVPLRGRSAPVEVLTDTTSNRPARSPPQARMEPSEPSCSVSLNRSYDVERPSGLWLLDPSESDSSVHPAHAPDHRHRTPESQGGGGCLGGVSKAKRRLLMHAKKEKEKEKEAEEERRRATDRAAGPPVRRPHAYASTPKGSPRGHGGRVAQADEQQLKQVHAAQWKALQAEQGRQQQHFIQPTARPQQQPSLPELHRPLVAAAVKGFLTRRLLKTARVEQLRRTAKDTQQFLEAFEQQGPGPGALRSRQDMLLCERVTLQLRAARYELHDVFFGLSAAERMQLIGWDRELARDRELKLQQTGPPGRAVGKSSLSAATQKSLERKRRVLMQQKATERPQGPRVRNGQRQSLKGDPTPRRRPGPLREARSQRVPKTSPSCRR